MLKLHWVGNVEAARSNNGCLFCATVRSLDDLDGSNPSGIRIQAAGQATNVPAACFAVGCTAQHQVPVSK